MDPPGSHEPPQPHSPPPQPFEIALIRKIEAKTRSVRDAFLLLDVDGDGHITPSDIRTVLHNEFGLDITQEQENNFFASTASKTCGNKGLEKSMTYAEYAKYFYRVSNITTTTSQYTFGAAVGFHRNDESGMKNHKGAKIDHEIPIELTPKSNCRKLRRDLRSLLTAHSSRTDGSGMKETSLFLAMDVHRSGKVTMQEFLDWLHSVGTTSWTMNDLKLVVLGVECDQGEEGWRDKRERAKLERAWFGAGNDTSIRGKEAGMTENEFAKFVESLDVDC
eukprot:CAMPEP_0171328474 /NCGR_PEP_ID=MMETSP0878-20121228/676_1 /TAXON_ID=67004 /ORGANISM="Thalassiosira weissflogii, Strain CCMP1336" /LENGTH=276 /DNA_ID=CAMNT_0011828327 /DNA_START=12 /DNA_END=842 /DNA_ORIENTATION=+